MLSNLHHKDIFERLLSGETIPSNDAEAFKLRDASYATKKLLVQLNNSSDPAEMRDLLRQITASEIDESVAVFTPLYINYGKHTKIGKNVFINFDCVFLDLGGITIEDNVLIPQKLVCCLKDILYALTIGNHWFPDIFTSKKQLGLVPEQRYFQE